MTERITYIELDLDRCSNTYGLSPCTASVGVTGADKCFNCLATCQDTPNYNTETVTQRYSTVSSKVPVNIDAIPCVSSVNIRPAKVELGESIGVRASVDINFMDFRSPDTGPDGDRYPESRAYDPYTLGTYFGKFRARYPFTKSSNLRVIRGNTDQSLDTMEIRNFIVDSVAGPDSGGSFKITCKDALKLADGKKAQAPILSVGELATSINETDTVVTLNPIGVGADYPASGIVNIGGKELCDYTISGDVMTLVRGQYNTDAATHKADSRAQLCLQYSGATTYEIFYDLFVNYAGIPTEYIPLNDWETEHNTYIQRAYSTIIAEPTSVTKLVNELLQQTASSMWWDDISRLIIFRVLKGVASTAPLYDDNIIKAGSFSAKDQPKKRVSQVWTYYGQIDPTQKLDEKNNYSNTLLTVSTESENNFGESSIKSIYSRWIISAARNAAERLNDLILSRYSEPPRLFSLTIQRDAEIVNPQIGGTYNLESWTLQDAMGAPKRSAIQAVQVNSSDTSFAVLAEEVLYSQTVAPEDPNNKPIAIDTDRNNVIISELFEEIYGDSDAGDIVTVTVADGVTVGSLSTTTGTYAIRTGLGWAAGVTIILVNNGVIAGKGGQGGAGGNIQRTGENQISGSLYGSNGTDGGDAVRLDYALTIENNGVLGGGGGGAGGGGAGYNFVEVFGIPITTLMGGGGGGTGAGQTIAAGGAAGIASGTKSEVVSGTPGGQSSATVAGGKGFGGISSNNNISESAGNGGNGGGLGVDGANGVNGSNNQGFPIWTGGLGGNAGAAIQGSIFGLTYSGNPPLGDVN